jgi:hypothetical protein
MSVFVLVDVKVGAVPPLHLTLEGHVTALAVPSATNKSVKPYALPVVGMLENVMLVIAAFNETANTLPSAQLSARTPADIVGAVLTSIKPVIVGVVSAALVASALAPEPVEVVTPVPPEATASVALKDAAEPVIDPLGTT